MMRPWLCLAAVASLLAAGCTGPADKTRTDSTYGQPDEPGSTLGPGSPAASPEDIKVQAKEGALVGNVTNDLGTPLENANIALIDTRFSSFTDATGRFSITNITPGAYTVRADHAAYVSVQGDVKVKAGEVTVLDVVLVPKVALSGDLREHVHDQWGTNTELTLGDSDLPFLWGRDQYTGQTGGTNGQLVDSIIGGYCLSPNAKVLGSPSTPIPFDERSTLVWRGTASMEVKVTWTSDDYQGDSLVFIYRGVNGSIYQKATIKSGESFRMDVDPVDWDASHQTYTNWALWVCPPRAVESIPPVGTGAAVPATGQFHALVKVYRITGPIPFEVAHPVLWPESGIVQVINTTRNLPTVPLTARSTTSSTDAIRPEDGVLVPPGTALLKARISWTTIMQGVNVPNPTQRSLTYRSADVWPFDAYSPGDLTRPEPSGKGDNWREYEIAITKDQTDQYYQTRSNWLFMVNWEGREDMDRYVEPCAPTAGCQLKVEIRVEAIRGTP